jgi:hypothetical protein
MLEENGAGSAACAFNREGVESARKHEANRVRRAEWFTD